MPAGGLFEAVYTTLYPGGLAVVWPWLCFSPEVPGGPGKNMNGQQMKEAGLWISRRKSL